MKLAGKLNEAARNSRLIIHLSGEVKKEKKRRKERMKIVEFYTVFVSLLKNNRLLFPCAIGAGVLMPCNRKSWERKDFLRR